MLFEDGQLVYCVDHPHYPDFSARVARHLPEQAHGEGSRYQVVGGIGTLIVPEHCLCGQKPITITPSMIDEVAITPAFAFVLSSSRIQLFVRVKTPVDEFIAFRVCMYFADEPHLDGRQRSQICLAPDTPLMAYRPPFHFLKKQTFHVVGHEDSLTLSRSASLRRQQAFVHDSRGILKSLNDKLRHDIGKIIQHKAVKAALDIAMADAFLVGPRVTRYACG